MFIGDSNIGTVLAYLQNPELLRLYHINVYYVSSISNGWDNVMMFIKVFACSGSIFCC